MENIPSWPLTLFWPVDEDSCTRYSGVSPPWINSFGPGSDIVVAIGWMMLEVVLIAIISLFKDLKGAAAQKAQGLYKVPP